MSVMEGQRISFNYEAHERYEDADYSHLLAEDLPVDYAHHRFRKLLTPRSASGWYRSAYAHIEFALCREAQLDDITRLSLINDCNYLLTKPLGLRSDSTSDTLRFDAAILSSYLPLFRRRCLQQPITAEDCNQLYESLGAALAMPVTSVHHRGRLDARLGEGVEKAFAARTRQPENIIFPTSPREEATRHQPSNHDGYFIRDGNKLRTQTKSIETALVYDDPTIIFNISEALGRIIKKTLKRHPDVYINIDITTLIDLIFRESSGEVLDPDEKYQLGVASALIMRPLSPKYTLVDGRSVLATTSASESS